MIIQVSRYSGCSAGWFNTWLAGMCDDVISDCCACACECCGCWQSSPFEHGSVNVLFSCICFTLCWDSPIEEACTQCRPPPQTGHATEAVMMYAAMLMFQLDG